MVELAPGLDLPSLNSAFIEATPAKIISWAFSQWDGDQILMSSSFGAESAVLIHMALVHHRGIRVVFTDTGYLFPETHAFMEELRRRFNLNVWVYRTRNDPITYLRNANETDPAWRNNVNECCALNKNEPFERAMKELAPKAWLRGIRANQSDARKSRQVVEWSPRYQCHVISPLLGWSTKQIHGYMMENDLPYHPLYEKGYASIGCNPLSCTRPIQPGEDPRSGRWAGTGKLECGINLNNSLDSAQL